MGNETTADAVRHESNAVPLTHTAELIAALDAVAELPPYSALTLTARTAPDAEYVLKLWASARNAPVEDDRWDADGKSHRVLRVMRVNSLATLATLIYPSVPL